MGTDHEHRVCMYAEAEAVIREHDPVYVNDCYCRAPAKQGKTTWEYCGHDIDTCMSFTAPTEPNPDWPTHEISQAEALAKFEMWREKGLMFRFMADESETPYLCCCCACGCGWFRDEEGNKGPDPCKKSAFIEQTDLEVCTACGACVDVCAYEARSLERGMMSVDRDKCYGCGACEYACPAGAVTMAPRESG
jgi:H+/Na+-translocating ferredoxin:NAD+ oxidoreductase subunit B